MFGIFGWIAFPVVAGDAEYSTREVGYVQGQPIQGIATLQTTAVKGCGSPDAMTIALL